LFPYADAAVDSARASSTRANGSGNVEAQVRTEIFDFVVENYLFGDLSAAPGDDDSLVERGIIDSTGVLELVEFLESHFGIEVTEMETVPENLDSISNLTKFVLGNRVGTGALH
jgi:acyl carrier protein